MKTPAPRAPSVIALPGFQLMHGTHAPGSVLPRHSHDLPSICCVGAGGFTEFYRGKAVDCGPGTVKITPAGDVHWNRFGDAWTEGVRIDVDPARFNDLPAVRAALDDRIFAERALVQGADLRLMASLPAADDAGRVALEGLLLELIAGLARWQDERSFARAPWLIRAHEMVTELYRTRISLSTIAAAVDIHPATLARGYRSAYGCSVGEHIRQLRLEHAAAELARTQLPLSAIALNAGFYDQSHFAHAFRRRFACTPARFRRSAGVSS